VNDDGEIDVQLLFMHTIAQSGYFSDFKEKISASAPECHKYTDEEVYHYNYYIWCIGFFYMGLQWTHLDIPIFRKFELRWEIMKTWGLFM